MTDSRKMLHSWLESFWVLVLYPDKGSCGFGVILPCLYLDVSFNTSLPVIVFVEYTSISLDCRTCPFKIVHFLLFLVGNESHNLCLTSPPLLTVLHGFCDFAFFILCLKMGSGGRLWFALWELVEKALDNSVSGREWQFYRSVPKSGSCFGVGQQAQLIPATMLSRPRVLTGGGNLIHAGVCLYFPSWALGWRKSPCCWDWKLSVGAGVCVRSSILGGNSDGNCSTLIWSEAISCWSISWNLADVH